MIFQFQLSDKKNNEHNESELFDNDSSNNNLYCNQNNSDKFMIMKFLTNLLAAKVIGMLL